MKPMSPWLIRKREDGGWTIWRWSIRRCQYISVADAATGAKALELYTAIAP